MRLLVLDGAFVVALWLVGRRPEPVAPRYHEPEDGVQPIDILVDDIIARYSKALDALG